MVSHTGCQLENPRFEKKVSLKTKKIGGRPPLPPGQKRVDKRFKFKPATVDLISIFAEEIGDSLDTKVSQRAICENSIRYCFELMRRRKLSLKKFLEHEKK